MISLVFVVAAYLIGSLSFAVIVSRAMGLADPRSFGSGNPGATNVLRSGKKIAALLTLLGDGAKGWLAVWLATLLQADYAIGEQTLAGVALAVVVGHMWPVLFGFKGGKGVATAAGVLFALHAWMGLATLGVWLGVAAIFRISSLAALTAALAAPVFCWLWLPGKQALFGAVLVISALLIRRHKSNILNLLAGTEGRIGTKASPPEA